MWSAAVLEPALPGLSSIARGSPVPSGPWSAHAPIGWNPKPFLNVAAASCFSECAVTRVASTSTTSGAFADRSWFGAAGPASFHAPARAAARAVSIAFSAAVASEARVSISRDTVGSDAT